jgi:catechol 2,3-dioxygenase-like lactoylglutathione lyase family enzyme
MGDARLRHIEPNSGGAHMTNIENLKKQAKQLVRWHRARRWTIATDIRNALPQFQGLSDREVFEQPLRLADAQAMIAKRHGYQGWQALAAGLAEQLPAADQAEIGPAPAAQVQQTLPFLFVSDVRAALAFYGEKLGFATEFAYGEPPFYAQVIRDGVRFAIKHADAPVIETLNSIRKGENGGEEFITCSVTLGSARQIFADYEAKGVTFLQRLRRETWGAWTFIVEDPDGNRIAFGGADEHAAAG